MKNFPNEIQMVFFQITNFNVVNNLQDVDFLIKF